MKREIETALSQFRESRTKTRAVRMGVNRSGIYSSGGFLYMGNYGQTKAPLVLTRNPVVGPLNSNRSPLSRLRKVASSRRSLRVFQESNTQFNREINVGNAKKMWNERSLVESCTILRSACSDAYISFAASCLPSLRDGSVFSVTQSLTQN